MDKQTQLINPMINFANSRIRATKGLNRRIPFAEVETLSFNYWDFDLLELAQPYAKKLKHFESNKGK